MQITCPRCKRTWEYTGAKESTPEIPAYTTCGSCRANVKLPIKAA